MEMPLLWVYTQVMMKETQANFISVCLGMGSERMKRKLISEDCANGETGVIFTTFDGKQTIFRKYFPDHQYKDYILTHPDLEVIINDPDAAFVEFDDGSAYLDLSAKSLEIFLKSVDKKQQS